MTIHSRKKNGGSVRIEDAAVARALDSVAKAEAAVSEWNKIMKSNISNPNVLGAIITGLKEANDRLDKAKEYHLQLTQP
jgi:lipopolysaccharide biosynthesis regulator YciM